VADCKVTVLPRPNRIRANVSAYAAFHFYSQIEAGLRAN
jgi:hypothetical protein